MKKEKMVTRTIVSTKADIKFYNVNDDALFNSELVFTGNLDEKGVKMVCLEMLEKHPERGITFVKVNHYETIEKLYGMPESVFLANAVELPPRKNNEAQEVE